jgi:uncharacterized membrane protein
VTDWNREPDRLDENLIVSYVEKHGGSSAGEISRALGYSRTAMAYVLTRLARRQQIRCEVLPAGRTVRKLWWPV